MGEHIGIGVTQKALLMGNINTPQNKPTPLGEGMNIHTLPNAQAGKFPYAVLTELFVHGIPLSTEHLPLLYAVFIT